MNDANPHLPAVTQLLRAEHTRRHRAESGEKFYLAALELAQSHWQHDKPAQALLQLNKAFLADLSDDAEILQQHPPPYRALHWFLQNRIPDPFLGNPVRHFQHLATRMSGSRPELRRHRAWVCFILAEKALPAHEFPRDQEQIARENITFPAVGDLVHYFKTARRPREADLVEKLIASPGR